MKEQTTVSGKGILPEQTTVWKRHTYGIPDHSLKNTELLEEQATVVEVSTAQRGAHFRTLHEVGETDLQFFV